MKAVFLNMKKKLGVVLLLYVVFFYLLYLISIMPDLIHGNRKLDFNHIGQSGIRIHIVDMLLSALFSIIPYVVLFNYFAKSRVWSIVLCLCSIPIIFLVSYYIQNYIEPVRLKMFFNEHFIYDIIYSALGVGFFFFRYSHFQEMQQKEAIILRRQAELSFLRSQINPHFLFNSLNNIYALVYKQSAQSLEALATLSDLLRYIIYDNEDKVQLQKELEYISKYISLQRLRFEHEIPVSFEVSGNINEVILAPLLLIPFVENAFKHGDLSVSSKGISINILVNREKIFFHCLNKIGNQQKDEQGGVGLQNVRRRLDLLYGGKYDLQVYEENDYFLTNLVLSYA
jgi:two-component system LytT family sensor kinase